MLTITEREREEREKRGERERGERERESIHSHIYLILVLEERKNFVSSTKKNFLDGDINTRNEWKTIYVDKSIKK